MVREVVVEKGTLKEKFLEISNFLEKLIGERYDNWEVGGESIQRQNMAFKMF